MYLAYFDENKYSEDNPYFYIGGFLISQDNAKAFEQTITQIQYNFFSTAILTKDTELHGKEIFHGKGNFRKRSIKERLQIFEDIKTAILNHNVIIKIVCINVTNHREKYRYPTPEYRLGLMLILERFCDFLDHKKDYGIVFGDYEQDEVSKSIVDFSQFKFSGKTDMYFGRPLGRLLDTIYFTHSHHSRYLQVADLVIFLAGRCEKMTKEPEKWLDKQVYNIWNELKEKTDFSIQNWP